MLFHEQLLSLFKANPISVFRLPQKLCSYRYALPFWYLPSLSFSAFSGCLSAACFVSQVCFLYSFTSCGSVISVSLTNFISVSILLSYSLLACLSLSLLLFLSTHPTSSVSSLMGTQMPCLLKIYSFLYLCCKHLTPKSSPLQANFTEKECT